MERSSIFVSICIPDGFSLSTSVQYYKKAAHAVCYYIICLPGQFVLSVDNGARKKLQILISRVDFSGLLFRSVKKN